MSALDDPSAPPAQSDVDHASATASGHDLSAQHQAPNGGAGARPSSAVPGAPRQHGGVDGVDGGAHPPHGKEIQQRAATIKQQYKHQKEKIKNHNQPPGGYDATPIPDAPPGWTVKFTFHRATNLPASDISTQRSDPFVLATLTTGLRKRHKEDPNLEHRTPTMRRNLEPEWEDEWIVANVPSTGFKLKCRIYDEDWPDHNDRLGNVTILCHGISDQWTGFTNSEFHVKKRAGNKHTYFFKAVTTAMHRGASMTPKLYLSAQVLGPSNSPPHGRIYTVGPTFYFRHFSPMIGRLAGVQVNKDEEHDNNDHEAEAAKEKAVAKGGSEEQQQQHEEKKQNAQKYDFQANEIQLQGPVPENLYHRYVEFRPMIGMMFTRKGLRGRILHKALSHQHNRIYNFDSSTEYGRFEPCSEEASLQFLRLAHFDQGGRVFTYVLTLDGLFRFTETGLEFGIDLLSKHTMHSNVATYIACSGEFFIRRRKKPSASAEPDQPTHPSELLDGGPPDEAPPTKPQYYQLVIDNDSGTYRPDASVLPALREYMARNFPGLDVVALGCDDEEDKKLKERQREIKKREGENMLVLSRSPSSSSISSSDESDLDEMQQAGDKGHKSKRERFLDAVADESPMHEFAKGFMPHSGGQSEETTGPSGTQQTTSGTTAGASHAK